MPTRKDISYNPYLDKEWDPRFIGPDKLPIGTLPGTVPAGWDPLAPPPPKPVSPSAPKPAPKPVSPSAPKPVAPSAPKPVSPSAPKPVAPSAPKPVSPSAPKPTTSIYDKLTGSLDAIADAGIGTVKINPDYVLPSSGSPIDAIRDARETLVNTTPPENLQNPILDPKIPNIPSSPLDQIEEGRGVIVDGTPPENLQNPILGPQLGGLPGGNYQTGQLGRPTIEQEHGFLVPFQNAAYGFNPTQDDQVGSYGEPVAPTTPINPAYGQQIQDQFGGGGLDLGPIGTKSLRTQGSGTSPTTTTTSQPLQTQTKSLTTNPTYPTSTGTKSLGDGIFKPSDDNDSSIFDSINGIAANAAGGNSLEDKLDAMRPKGGDSWENDSPTGQRSYRVPSDLVVDSKDYNIGRDPNYIWDRAQEVRQEGTEARNTMEDLGLAQQGLGMSTGYELYQQGVQGGKNLQDYTQDAADNLAGLEATEGPSAAQAQLRSGLNQAQAANLSLARSGRGWGGSTSALTQAINANAGMGQEAANQAAVLRAQENAQWRQRQAQNLGTAAQIGATGIESGTRLGMEGTQGYANLGFAGNNAAADLYGKGYAAESGADAAADQLWIAQNNADMAKEGDNLQKYGIDKGVPIQAEGGGPNPYLTAGLTAGGALLGGLFGGPAGAMAGGAAGGAVGTAVQSDRRSKKDIEQESADKLGQSFTALFADKFTPKKKEGEEDEEDEPEFGFGSGQGLMNTWMSGQMGPGYGGTWQQGPNGMVSQPIPGFGVTSDEEAKEGAREMMSSLDPYTFNYKDPDRHGHGRQLGVMAQDLEKSPMGASTVFRGPDGYRGVDTDKMTMANTAGLAALWDDVQKLKKRRRVA